jgi:hypothetical protein
MDHYTDEILGLRLAQFGQWVQMDADHLLAGKLENVKIFASEVSRHLTNAAIVNVGYRVDMPCRVLGHHIMKRPANRWAHFKLAVFPAWALAKWPPRMTETQIEIRELFPALKLPPHLQPHAPGQIYQIYEKSMPALEGNDD